MNNYVFHFTFLLNYLKVVLHDSIRDRLSQTLLSMVRREREGEAVDRYITLCSHTVEQRFNKKQYGT